MEKCLNPFNIKGNDEVNWIQIILGKRDLSELKPNTFTAIYIFNNSIVELWKLIMTNRFVGSSKSVTANQQFWILGVCVVGVKYWSTDILCICC